MRRNTIVLRSDETQFFWELTIHARNAYTHVKMKEKYFRYIFAKMCNFFLVWEHYTYISNNNCVCIDVETYSGESLFL